MEEIYQVSYGLKKNMYSETVQSEVVLDDLFGEYCYRFMQKNELPMKNRTFLFIFAYRCTKILIDKKALTF